MFYQINLGLPTVDETLTFYLLGRETDNGFVYIKGVEKLQFGVDVINWVYSDDDAMVFFTETAASEFKDSQLKQSLHNNINVIELKIDSDDAVHKTIIQ